MEPPWLPRDGDSFWGPSGTLCAGSFWSEGSSSEPFWLLMSGSSLGAPLALLRVEIPSRPLLAPFPAPLSGANLAPSEADPAPFEAVPDPSGTEAPLRSPSSSLWCQSGSLEWSRSGSPRELKNGSSWGCTGSFWSGTLLQSPSSLKADSSSSWSSTGSLGAEAPPGVTALLELH